MESEDEVEAGTLHGDIPSAETGNIKLSAAPAFTPAPWGVFGSDYHLSVGPNAQSPIVTIVPFLRGSPMYERDKANAHLIAAAPAMYEALTLCEKELAFIVNGTNKHGGLYEQALSAACLALRSAEGWQHGQDTNTRGFVR